MGDAIPTKKRFVVTCGGCAKTKMYKGTSYEMYKKTLDDPSVCGVCRQRRQAIDDPLAKEKRDRDDKIRIQQRPANKLKELQLKMLAEIAKTNEENMKILKKNELKNRLNQEIQLIQTRLQQYNDKKNITKKVFEEYKSKLFQIKLEEKRLKKYFYKENSNKNILNIVLIGITGHGKSMFACRLAGDTTDDCSSGIFQHSDCIFSETQNLKKKIVENMWSKDLSVTDTPGIFDSGGKDREHTNNLIEFLRGCGGVNAFILVKNRYPPRFSSSFKDVLKNLEILLGRAFWKYVIILITHTKGKDILTFDQYASTFRDGIYHEMQLNKNEANLPFIGVDSVENYKKPIKKLINIISANRYQCDELRSPLQELKLKNQNLQRKFDNLKQELNMIKQTISLSKKQITNMNKRLKTYQKDYVMQNVDLSLIDNEPADLWNINIVLPDDDDDKKTNNKRNNNNNDDDQKTKEPKVKKPKVQKPNWVAYKQVTYKYLADLDDDEITLSFTDDNFKPIPWGIKLDPSHDKYNEWIKVFECGSDVLVTIIENHYKNTYQETQTKMNRIIKNIEEY